MSIEDIYFELENLPLTGEITTEDGHIKWKYDSFMIYSGVDIEEHLEEVYSEDKELIEELMDVLVDEYTLTLPEYEETWVHFYIEN